MSPVLLGEERHRTRRAWLSCISSTGGDGQISPRCGGSLPPPIRRGRVVHGPVVREVERAAVSGATTEPCWRTWGRAPCAAPRPQGGVACVVPLGCSCARLVAWASTDVGAANSSRDSGPRRRSLRLLSPRPPRRASTLSLHPPCRSHPCPPDSARRYIPAIHLDHVARLPEASTSGHRPAWYRSDTTSAWPWASTVRHSPPRFT